MIQLLTLRGDKTQAFIAKKLGLNRQTYCNYENGSRQASYDTLIKMADYFGVSIDYLLGRTDTHTDNNITQIANGNNNQQFVNSQNCGNHFVSSEQTCTAQECELLNLFRQADESKKEALLSYAKFVIMNK